MRLLRVLGDGVVREVSVLAGAAAGVLVLKYGLQRAADYSALQGFGRVQASGFAPLMLPLLAMDDAHETSSILSKVEELLRLVEEPETGGRGFVANRLASEIPARVALLVKHGVRSSDAAVSTRAMDYERDELEVLRGECDETVRRMLLNSYA